MKKTLFASLATLLAVVVLGGVAAAYFILGNQDRGTTADGRMAPPASVRNAPEAPKFDASKEAVPVTAERPAEYQLPTEFKLPTDMDIATPPIPEGLSASARRAKVLNRPIRRLCRVEFSPNRPPSLPGLSFRAVF